MKPELVVVADIAEVAVERFLTLRPRTIALAGGSTPRALYRRLAVLDYRWDEVDVFFGDERCVPADHVDSNYRLAHAAFLSRVAAKVHRMPSETCDPDAYERELTSVFGQGAPQFDLVLLGLGEDGHTASLFPRDKALAECDRRVVKVERPDHPRLTLTLPVFSAARAAIFLVSGERKQWALSRLLEGNDDVPASRVRAREILIIADEAAAGHDRSPGGAWT